MAAASVRGMEGYLCSRFKGIQIIGPGDCVSRSEARVSLEVGVPGSPGFYIVSAASKMLGSCWLSLL